MVHLAFRGEEIQNLVTNLQEQTKLSLKLQANLDQSVMAHWSEEMQNLVTNLQEQTKLSLNLQANLGSICHGSLERRPNKMRDIKFSL